MEYAKKNTRKFDRYIKVLAKKKGKRLSANAVSLLDSYLHSILETRVALACQFRDTANPSRVTLLQRDIQTAINRKWNIQMDKDFTDFVHDALDQYSTHSKGSRANKAGLTVSVGRVDRLVRDQDGVISHQIEKSVFIYVAALIEFVILFVFRNIQEQFPNETRFEKHMIAKVFEMFTFFTE